MQEQAGLLGERLGCSGLAVATLEGEPGLRAALHLATGRRALVLPILMADGWTFRERLPVDLAKALQDGGPDEIAVCAPIGLARELAPMIAARATREAERRGWSASQCTLLLVAHGTKRDGNSYRATERHAKAIRDTAVFAAVKTGYLEQEPGAADVIARLSGPLIVIGMFAAPGVHATTDMEELLAGHGSQAAYLGPVSDDPALTDLLVRQTARAGAMVAVADSTQDELALRLRHSCAASASEDS